MLISEPYIYCPRCHQKTFGTFVSISSQQSYSKECTACGYSRNYPLPGIKKRIVYLDQFVIDNFVKALDPKHPKHVAALREPFWLEVFKKLDVLVRAQLIVCPDSFFHREESGPTGYFESMQRIYEHLSTGITFDHGSEVIRKQICEHFGNFLRSAPDVAPVTLPEKIAQGKLHEWNGRLQISINMKPRAEEVSEVMQGKARTYQNFLEIFERWKTETGKGFDDWYKEETDGFATGTMGVIQDFARRKAQAPEKFLRDGTVNLNDLLPPPSVWLIEAMQWTAQKEGITDPAEVFKKIGEYLFSDKIELVPGIRIGSLLYAALADQAAHGRTQPPSKGVIVDVDMISSFLPYCDAMFIDKENAALLDDGRVKKKLGVGTHIYSLRDREAFLSYLDGILTTADPKHFELVEQTYGPGWKDPYLTILSRSR